MMLYHFKDFLVFSSVLLAALSSSSHATYSTSGLNDNEDNVAKILSSLPIKVEEEKEEKAQSRKRLANARQGIEEPQAKRSQAEAPNVVDLTSQGESTHPPASLSPSRSSDHAILASVQNRLEILQQNLGQLKKDIASRVPTMPLVPALNLLVSSVKQQVYKSAELGMPTMRPQGIGDRNHNNVSTSAPSLAKTTVSKPALPLFSPSPPPTVNEANEKLSLASSKRESSPQEAERLLKEVIEDSQARPETRLMAKVGLAFTKRESAPQEAERLLKEVIEDSQAPPQIRTRARVLLGALIIKGNFPHRQFYEGILLFANTLNDPNLSENNKCKIQAFLNTLKGQTGGIDTLISQMQL